MKNVVQIVEEEDEDVFTEIVQPKNTLIKDIIRQETTDDIIRKEAYDYLSVKEKYQEYWTRNPDSETVFRQPKDGVPMYKRFLDNIEEGKSGEQV